MPCMSFIQAQTHTHTLLHTESLREIYTSAWQRSNPQCQSSSTWALLSLAGRQRPIYQTPLEPPHLRPDTEGGSGGADSRRPDMMDSSRERRRRRFTGGRNDESGKSGGLMTENERKEERAKRGAWGARGVTRH